MENNENKLVVLIKSNHILQRIFVNLNEYRYLQIIKYSKYIHNRLGVDEKNFKNHLKVELEIIPLINYGENDTKFINIENGKESYFHIYFDDSREEIKRNYLKKDEKVAKIKVAIDYDIESFKGLFEKCHFSSIKFIKFNRKDIKNMDYMFSRCTELRKIDLTNFKTNNVIDMSFMFNHCIRLEELNLSNFANDNLINMKYMFSGCLSLKSVNFSNFKTNNVTDMSFLFNNCTSLKELNLTDFDTSKVTKMNYMFNYCSSLKQLYIYNFNTNNVIDMNGMFCNCIVIKELNLSSFNTEKATNLNYVFKNCLELCQVDIPNNTNKQLIGNKNNFERCQTNLNIKMEEKK